jgi:phage baseplate assembly protein gpV
MNALIAAFLLAALPYPAPRLAAVSDATKYDQGAVVSMDVAKGELRVRCLAGLVTFKAGPEVQVFDAAGKPAGAPAALVAGQKLRIWYVVERGARALEIALE